ncbi:MAG: 5'-methylthioadenosine/S-adenosylhomocysteine nucleosidase [Candidatus Thioglobus sp.]|nr:5'-methylthioadenosine/S-adenosylhomocysteine nucleosidase [Candidatus Thioglobus pontius]MBL6984517.1 5'-methylthioadenosine/S-adenosylhomocysteine nucleosidase [Candidatus Thioglobus sp.]
MTNIGIVCAMSEEVQKIVSAFELQPIEAHLGYNIYQNNNVTLIESSIGKVASSLAATTLINKFNITQIVNIGLAGALKSIPAGKAYFVSSVSQHDAFIPFDEYQQDMYQSIECQIPDHAKNTLVLTTGDQFITNSNDINNSADIVDMEGFAVAYIANRYNLPITMIKGVSDDANNSSESELFENLNLAMDQTITLLKQVI